MHKGGNNYFIGKMAIFAGILIILALILPTKFWWFILGITFICFGVWFKRCK